jgi:hypothetical protein
MPEIWSPGASLNFGNVGCLPGLARIIVGRDVIEEGVELYLYFLTFFHGAVIEFRDNFTYFTFLYAICKWMPLKKFSRQTSCMNSKINTANSYEALLGSSCNRIKCTPLLAFMSLFS